MNAGCCTLSSTWHVTFPNKRKRNVSYTHHFSSVFITSLDNQISTVFSFSLIVIILATLPEIRKAGWFKHLSFRHKHFHGGRYFGELLHSQWGSSTVAVTQWSASICLRCPARFVHAWNGPPHNRTHVRLTGQSPHRAEKAGKSADSILWPTDWCMSVVVFLFFSISLLYCIIYYVFSKPD